jgi:uncharacterized membrane protein YccC
MSTPDSSAAFADTWPGRLLHAARLLAACAVCTIIATEFGLKESYWALITVVVVTQPALTETIDASRTRIIGTLVGAAAGFVVLEAVQHGLPRLPLFWLALAPLALLSAIRQTLRLSCITLIVVVLIPAGGPPFERPLDRVYGILLGAAASIVMAAIAWVRQSPREADRECAQPPPACSVPPRTGR